MSSFVLVHGAWHGSWCWKRVRKTLRSAGHEVFTPTLTGVGERSHLLSEKIDLETHIMDVINLICWEELSSVVLCGHSYGGCVVTGVADRIPEKIAALVYLDAFVPEDGENLMQHIPADQHEQIIVGAEKTGDGWRLPPIPAEVFRVNETDRAWVNSQCTPQPLATFEQRLHLTGGIDDIADITYVRATGFEEGSPFPPFLEKARAKGWKTIEIDCGHDVMLDRPQELSRLLLETTIDRH
jgi:pimeloyl-ACP methyl ester carboxylesterase